MTITNGYCTADEFRSFCNIDSTESKTIHETVVSAASRNVDRHCGRRFWQDSTVVDREYHADSPTVVLVDDISTATGLVVKIDINYDGTYAYTLSASTDYVTYPINAEDEVPARPFTELRIPSFTSVQQFPRSNGRPGVRVTAKYGWAAVPDEVKMATILQAQMLHTAKDSRGGILSASVDGFSTRMSRFVHPQAELLLADFVKAPR